MAASERTIVTKGKSKGHHDEGILDTVATPGMHIQLASDGHYDKSPATAAELVKTVPQIVTEDSMQGKTVSDAYAIGDIVRFYMPTPGDHCLLLCKTGENLAVHDYVTPEGGGTGLWIEAAGTEAQYHFEVLESSGGALGAAALIKCRRM